MGIFKNTIFMSYEDATGQPTPAIPAPCPSTLHQSTPPERSSYNNSLLGDLCRAVKCKLPWRWVSLGLEWRMGDGGWELGAGELGFNSHGWQLVKFDPAEATVDVVALVVVVVVCRFIK